jgi:hypothetical protein
MNSSVVLVLVQMIFFPCDNIVDYEKINPIKYVPAFVDGDFVVSDSLAIILVRCTSLIFLIYKHFSVLTNFSLCV